MQTMIKVKETLNSIKFASSGIQYLLKHEPNARIHLIATIIVIFISIWVNLSSLEWVAILVAICLVWTAELFNTALETIFNLVEPGQNPLVKIGKDTAAGAVLVMAVLSVLIGSIILIPAVIEKIFPWLLEIFL